MSTLFRRLVRWAARYLKGERGMSRVESRLNLIWASLTEEK